MKIMLIFGALFTQVALADFSYVGDLIDFDDKLVSTCSLKSKTRLFSNKRILLKEVTFLNESFKGIKLKLFSKNGINGNIYLPVVRNFSDYHFMLNTNDSFEVVELAINAGIGTLEESYRCINLNEE